ncbi:hypothetical protein AAFF_G00202600 [Aldrovandia affinis]|uniref:Uncharacterized protein n=1 Tax=Aldrovandia affinis TaxID=143900 RepID=A0AAD7WVZ2_9TELE|nr:hypothetical protein AAFF_G00202600 [Aldrovandia affinis]
MDLGKIVSPPGWRKGQQTAEAGGDAPLPISRTISPAFSPADRIGVMLVTHFTMSSCRSDREQGFRGSGRRVCEPREPGLIRPVPRLTYGTTPASQLRLPSQGHGTLPAAAHRDTLLLSISRGPRHTIMACVLWERNGRRVTLEQPLPLSGGEWEGGRMRERLIEKISAV